MFEDKFENIQEAHPNLKEYNSFEVYNLKEICAKYHVEQEFILRRDL